MKSIDDYVYEVLHLKSNNKDLVPMDDPSDFIESFEEWTVKLHIISLLGMAIDCQESLVEDGITDRRCYIVKTKHKERDGSPVYKWYSNGKNEMLNVGDTNMHDSTVLYIVTKDTVMPEKYKEYLRKP